MKRYAKLLVIAAMILCSTGCFRYDVSMEISKDKSMKLKFIYAINKEQMEETMSSLGDSFSTEDSYDEEYNTDLYDSEYDSDYIMEDENLDSDLENPDSTLSDDDFTEMIDEAEEVLGKRGYQISEYNEDGYRGFLAVLNIDNIDDVSVEKDLTVAMSELLEEDFNDKELFTVKKGFFKNTYTAKYVYKIDENEDAVGSLLDSSMFSSMFDMNYSIKVPYTVKTDNADNHDGDLLKWKIALDKDTNIQFSFEVPNTINIVIVFGGGLILILILFILSVNISKKEKIVQK